MQAMTTRFNLAETLSTRNPEESERLHRRCLAWKASFWGASAVQTSSSYSSLGNLLRRKGDLDEAEILLKKAVAIREATPGGRRRGGSEGGEGGRGGAVFLKLR